MEMTTILKLMLAGALVAASWAMAAAQQAATQRVMGTIEAVNGPTLTVKTRDGETKVNVTDNVAVFGVAKATLADLKPGAFVGVGAMPQPDGSQKAIRVMIFAESQRGTGEGHRPWVQPGSTMTNGTIETTVGSVDGQTLMVKYKDGEKKIIMPPGLDIQQYVVGEKSELKPGAAILITAAVKKPDGSLEANRVNVGRGGVVPQ
jgi:hypothetical protein